ncbi:endoglucanase [Kosakonia oryzendophytica]|uniref:Glucanase n=1 Tax=Kosakonia oryzendophytica TaxID=1005665 RepID=A0A1C4CRE0_9ENTR|nr:glycosyl hydrolase family 8 [Kosakonia oryzendophytica]TDT56894.1 endoglucanase [Enterobacter sp. AG5470]SCC21599.1 endoglucanase [Kosakonia oryzendophytica]
MLRTTWLMSCLLLSLAMTSFSARSQDGNWVLFKQNYLSQDGRIVDHENGDISHSEGQGYGMLLAVMNDDPASFEKIWRWTRNTLLRPSLWLFAWRYDPQQHKVTDDNNASDGDTLIAWALLLAGNKWHDQSYLTASENIQEALINCLIIEQDTQTLLLPGLSGFTKDDGYIINPSYFIFPAWDSFWQHQHNDIWLKLKKSSLNLLDKARFGKTQLPSDWIFVKNNGEVIPADNWPARFSYDAIRIPLYLSLSETQQHSTDNFRHFWANYARSETPAWVDVSGEGHANYSMSGGILAVRDLTMGDYQHMDKSVRPGEGYYLSVLHMLSLFAVTLKKE